METLLNITTEAGYTEANTLSWPQGDLLELQVANAAVFARFQRYDPERQNTLPFGDELYITPRTRIYGGCSGVKVRDAVAGTHAQVSAAVYGKDDVRPSADAPFDLFVSPSGAVSSFPMITGRVAANGAVQAGTGFTVNHSATGTYVITFETPFASTPCVLITPRDNGEFVFGLSGDTATTVTVRIAASGGSGVGVDCPFTFVAIPTQ